MSFCNDALSPVVSSPAHFSVFPMMSSLDLLNFLTRPSKLVLKKLENSDGRFGDVEYSAVDNLRIFKYFEKGGFGATDSKHLPIYECSQTIKTKRNKIIN